MLRKAYRLPRRAIGEVVNKGRAIHSPFFTIKILPSTELKPHFAFVASKKVFKLAVTRNKAKRRMKAVILKLRNNLLAFSGVFLLKKDIVTSNFDDIIKSGTESLKDFLKK